MGVCGVGGAFSLVVVISSCLTQLVFKGRSCLTHMDHIKLNIKGFRMKQNGGPSEYPKVSSTHRACEVMQWGANVSSTGAPATRKWMRDRGWFDKGEVVRKPRKVKRRTGLP